MDSNCLETVLVGGEGILSFEVPLMIFAELVPTKEK